MSLDATVSKARGPWQLSNARDPRQMPRLSAPKHGPGCIDWQVSCTVNWQAYNGFITWSQIDMQVFCLTVFAIIFKNKTYSFQIPLSIISHFHSCQRNVKSASPKFERNYMLYFLSQITLKLSKQAWLFYIGIQVVQTGEFLVMRDEKCECLSRNMAHIQ